MTLDEAVQEALRERRPWGLGISDHRSGDTVVASGWLSHHLSQRPDDHSNDSLRTVEEHNNTNADIERDRRLRLISALEYALSLRLLRL